MIIAAVKKLLRNFLIFSLPLIPVSAYAGSRAELVQYLLSGVVNPSTGERCDGCKVYFCAAGTSTPKDIYTAYDKTTAAANPLTLSSQGIAKVYADGAYKFIIKDAAGSTLYTYDNLNFNYDALETIASTTSGSGTAYTISISPAPSSYFTNMTVVAKAHVVSGASPTINVNGLGAKSLKNSIGSALVANDIAEGQVFIAYYDGTDFILADGAGSGSTSLVASGYYAGASTGAANTYVLNYTPDVEAYTDGRIYTFKAHQSNTSTATIQIDGLTAKSLRTSDGAALTGGEIQYGSNGPLIQVWYNSADDQFRLVEKRYEFYYGGTSDGAANAQTLTLAPALPAYKAGQTFFFIPGFANTGSASLNINGLGTKTIKTPYGNDLAIGMLNTTQVAVVTYNGTSMVLNNATSNWQSWTPTTGAGGGGTWDSVTCSDCAYKYEEDGSVTIRGKVDGTITGTVNEMYISLPVNTAVTSEQAASGAANQNSTQIAAHLRIQSSTDRLRCIKYDTGNFTAGAGSGFFFYANYRL